MKNIKALIFAQIILLIGLVFVNFAKDAPYKADKTYAFTNVNVIPMDRERVLRNRDVIVENGMIIWITKGKKIPADAIKIDGTGKYLIPGLVDMHTHLFSDYEFPDSLAEDELKIMLANGVTTTRLMIGVPQHLELREKSRKSEILAPTIYAASPQFAGRSFGDIYNGYVVTNEEQARESVRQAKKDGYDFIKMTFWITRPVYDAVIDEAKKQNIRVIGHVDAQVGIERVFEARQQIEHLDGFFEALIPDGSELKFSTSGVNVWNPRGWDSLDVLDEKKLPELAKRAVKANPYSVPTLTFLKLAFGIGQTDEDIKSRPDYRFLPGKIRDEMAGPRRAFWNGQRLPSEKRRMRYVDLRNKIVKAIHDAGGKIMAGSDAPEWFLLYGYTLHRELESLSQAGLSNYAVLESATRYPAEFFGAADKFGTVEKGKRGDLVLLDANPLIDISNTQKIAGVMVRGNWMPKEKIDGMLDEIAPKFQTAFDKKEPAEAERFGKETS
jgi:imidazolonepropionase-like amidohydrolase